MRTFYADIRKPYRIGTFGNYPDAHGVNHIIRVSERGIHEQSPFCACAPRVTNIVDDDGFRALAVIHRKMLNSRALYQPWEAGH